MCKTPTTNKHNKHDMMVESVVQNTWNYTVHCSHKSDNDCYHVTTKEHITLCASGASVLHAVYLRMHKEANMNLSFLLTLLHSNLKLTSWSLVFAKLIVALLVQKLFSFYGTQRLITMFTRACHLSLS